MSESGAIHGLKVAAVAVVALAVWGMGKTLCPDAKRASLAALAAFIALAWPSVIGQVGAMLLCGLIGRWHVDRAGWRLRRARASRLRSGKNGCDRRLACLFRAALWSAAALTLYPEPRASRAFDSFYRSSAPSFLEADTLCSPCCERRWFCRGGSRTASFSRDTAPPKLVPGPLFRLAAYLGTVMTQPPNGWSGATLCLVAIFLPSFLLVVGALPLWETLRGTAAEPAPRWPGSMPA